MASKSEKRRKIKGGPGTSSSILAQSWKQMTPAQKEPFLKIAAEDKKRYELEMKKYKRAMKKYELDMEKYNRQLNLIKKLKYEAERFDNATAEPQTTQVTASTDNSRQKIMEQHAVDSEHERLFVISEWKKYEKAFSQGKIINPNFETFKRDTLKAWRNMTELQRQKFIDEKRQEMKARPSPTESLHERQFVISEWEEYKKAFIRGEIKNPGFEPFKTLAINYWRNMTELQRQKFIDQKRQEMNTRPSRTESLHECQFVISEWEEYKKAFIRGEIKKPRFEPLKRLAINYWRKMTVLQRQKFIDKKRGKRIPRLSRTDAVHERRLCQITPCPVVYVSGNQTRTCLNCLGKTMKFLLSNARIKE